MILLVGICFSMTSCTKARTLKNTSWFGVESYGSYTVTYTLKFYESTFTFEESDNEFYTGTYTYDDPVVTLYLTGQGSFSGTVSGNNLILNGVTFTKM